MLSPDRHNPREGRDRQPIAPVGPQEEVGDFHYDSGGYTTAAEYYENAFRGLGAEHEFDPTVAARLCRKISDCHRSKGLLEEALVSLERARGFLRGYEFEVEYGVVLGRRSDLQSAQGKHEPALRDALLALEILKGTAAHREYAFVQTIAAACHGRLGHQAEFEQFNLDALATYRRIDDQVGIADVYNNLGLAYKNACQWDKSIRSLTKAKEIAEARGLTRRLARTLGNLGIVYTKTRDFHEAISHLSRARKYALTLGDHASQVSILNSLGRVLTMTGRFSKAEKCLLEARVRAEKHQLARSQALADEFLGDLMTAQGRLEEARQNYDCGLKKARKLAPKGDVVGEILRRLAELELQQGLRSQAVTTAKRALRVCKDCAETHEIGYIHRTLGLASRGLGKPREASAHLEASVAAFEKTRNTYELGWSRIHLAEHYLEQGGREPELRAVREATTAVELFRATEEEPGFCAAGLLLARAQKAIGHHDEGLLVLYEVERLCEETPSLGSLAEVRALRKEFECALVSSVARESSQLNLFSELYLLAGERAGLEANLDKALKALCTRTRCTTGFLVLLFPGQQRALVKAARGIDASEVPKLARHFLEDGDPKPCCLAKVDGALAKRFPAVATRAESILCQPLVSEGRTLGLLYLERAVGQGVFHEDEVDFVATYASLASVLLFEKFREEFLAPESIPSREEMHPATNRILTTDPGMFQVLRLAEKVSRSNCTVLLSGETGTGKGLLAHSIHLMSELRGRKFIALNCAALPEPLLESELFGHVRGAFTGADCDKIGLLEAAHGGTVFLDEVGKTSLAMQGKLLQFLDSSEVRRVGSNVFRKVEVRVVCASKSNLRDLVATGAFLEDLYYRLNDFPIAIPPLRDRKGDIKLLVSHFLRKSSEEMQKPSSSLSRSAMQILQGYRWPGNVRELQKCIKRAVILADPGQPISARHLPDELKSHDENALEEAPMQNQLTLRQHVARLEAHVIRDSLRRSAGNKSEAARLLGISYPSLLQKIKAYGVEAKRQAGKTPDPA